VILRYAGGGCKTDHCSPAHDFFQPPCPTDGDTEFAVVTYSIHVLVRNVVGVRNKVGVSMEERGE
jgi:hypothetical protein